MMQTVLGSKEMIDLHTHSLLSDGVLLPEELVRRCEQNGCSMLAIADHVGFSNIEQVVPALVQMVKSLRGYGSIEVLAGAEITHVRPELVARAVQAAREAGAAIVVGHGETIVEPVLPGTNRALIEAGVDILAHPGLISAEDAELAARKGVCLEISGRKGHSFTNGHVLQAARRAGAKIVFDSDGHDVGDYPTREKAERIALGAGMTPEEVVAMFANSVQLFQKRSSSDRN